MPTINIKTVYTVKVMVRHTKRFLIFVIGGTIVGIGLILLLLPGPGTLVIIIGLAILATEFVWAERALRHAKSGYHNGKNRLKGILSKNNSKPDTDLTDQT